MKPSPSSRKSVAISARPPAACEAASEPASKAAKHLGRAGAIVGDEIEPDRDHQRTRRLEGDAERRIGRQRTGRRDRRHRTSQL